MIPLRFGSGVFDLETISQTIEYACGVNYRENKKTGISRKPYHGFILINRHKKHLKTDIGPTSGNICHRSALRFRRRY